MVKAIDVQRSFNDAIDFMDVLLENDIIIPGYTQEEVEDLRERLCNNWSELDDGEIIQSQ